MLFVINLQIQPFLSFVLCKLCMRAIYVYLIVSEGSSLDIVREVSFVSLDGGRTWSAEVNFNLISFVYSTCLFNLFILLVYSTCVFYLSVVAYTFHALRPSIYCKVLCFDHCHVYLRQAWAWLDGAHVLLTSTVWLHDNNINKYTNNDDNVNM